MTFVRRKKEIEAYDVGDTIDLHRLLDRMINDPKLKSTLKVSYVAPNGRYGPKIIEVYYTENDNTAFISNASSKPSVLVIEDDEIYTYTYNEFGDTYTEISEDDRL